MKRILISFIIGLAAMGFIMFKTMPKLMMSEVQSPLGYEATLAQIQQSVTNGGWKVSAVMRLDQSLAKEGRHVQPVTSLKICQPDHAETVLTDDAARFLSVMMPCTIAVYEKSDGKTYVSTMNAGLMGRLFGGTVSDVMAGPVARETASFLSFID